MLRWRSQHREDLQREALRIRRNTFGTLSDAIKNAIRAMDAVICERGYHASIDTSLLQIGFDTVDLTDDR
jgi:hypothetical protein